MARRSAQYLLVTSTRPFDAVRQSLAGQFRVLAGGSGTVEAPTAMWFELTRRGAPDTLPALSDLQAALTPADAIVGLQRVTEGGGKDLARQISLLSSCGEGLWRETVLGGGEHRTAPEKPKEALDTQQMPLFG
jgi:hypothetical protein